MEGLKKTEKRAQLKPKLAKLEDEKMFLNLVNNPHQVVTGCNHTRTYFQTLSSLSCIRHS